MTRSLPSPYIQPLSPRRPVAVRAATRGGLQIRELLRDVLLDKFIPTGFGLEMRVQFANHQPRGFDKLDPVLNLRDGIEAGRVQGGLHGTALRMTANNDGRHLQHGDGLLDGGGHSLGPDVKRRHDNARVPNDKQLADTGMCDLARNQARVRAGDEQAIGRLSLGHRLELPGPCVRLRSNRSVRSTRRPPCSQQPAHRPSPGRPSRRLASAPWEWHA